LRISHFEELKPLCPRCRQNNEQFPLALKHVDEQRGEHIISAVLQCANKLCAALYPVIDAVPVLIHPLSDYLRSHCDSINSRLDLSLVQEAMLGDASGIGSRFNQQRHYLSTYVDSHYGDFVQEHDEPSATILPLLKQGFELLAFNGSAWNSTKGNIIDIGCACGRSSFALADQFKRITLGVDLNFYLLRFAQQLLIEGEAEFPLKQSGLVYRRHRIAFSATHNELVDFWAADASALPLADNNTALCSAFNVLDAVNSPRQLISGLAGKLTTNGALLLSTPYDWSGNTPAQHWLGAQAQYSDNYLDCADTLRQLLVEQGYAIMAEKDRVEWRLRMHARQYNHYQLHMLAALHPK